MTSAEDDAPAREFGRQLRAARTSIGPVRFSQAAMARLVARELQRMGHRPTSSEDSIARWESGKIKPEPHQVLAYCKGLIAKGYSREKAFALLNVGWLPHVSEVISLGLGANNAGVPFERVVVPGAEASASNSVPEQPSFSFWINEAEKLLRGRRHEIDVHGGIFCAQRARQLARSDLEWANATFLLGVGKQHLSELGEAIDYYDQVIDRFAGTIEIDRLAARAKAAVQKAKVLALLTQSDEAIELYNETIRNFAQRKDYMLREQVMSAYLSKALLLEGLGRLGEAIDTFDALLAMPFEDSDEHHAHLEFAILGMGQALNKDSRSQQAVDFCVKMMPELRFEATRAINYFHLGNAYSRLKEHEKALNAFDESLSAHVAIDVKSEGECLFNKASALRDLGKYEEALEIYDLLLAESPKEEIRNKSRAMKALVLGYMARSEESLCLLDEVIKHSEGEAKRVALDFKNFLEKSLKDRPPRVGRLKHIEARPRKKRRRRGVGG